MPSSYSISSHEAQSVVQLEVKVTVQVSRGHSTQAGWETQRQLSLSMITWGGMTWHRPPLALRPDEVTARLERARNSACWESERILYITEWSDNTRGCHYHNPDIRQRCHAYRACNPLIWVGWEMCVGHKCLWRGHTVKTEWNVKYVEFQTNINPECVHYSIRSYLICPAEFVRCLWCHCIRAAGRCVDPALVQQILYKHKNRGTQAQFHLTINHNQALAFLSYYNKVINNKVAD